MDFGEILVMIQIFWFILDHSLFGTLYP